VTDIEAAGLATSATDDTDEKHVSVLWWVIPALVFWIALIVVAL
jgi:hypothetical protein